MTIHAAAHAYPSKAADPAIDHVDFTVWWPALGSKSGPWKTACTVRRLHRATSTRATSTPSISARRLASCGSASTSMTQQAARTSRRTESVRLIGRRRRRRRWLADVPGRRLRSRLPGYGHDRGNPRVTDLWSLFRNRLVLYGGSGVEPTGRVPGRAPRLRDVSHASSYDYTTLLKEMLSFYSLSSSDVAVTQRDISVDGNNGLYFSMEGGGSGPNSKSLRSATTGRVMAGHQTTDTTLDSRRFFDSFHLR